MRRKCSKEAWKGKLLIEKRAGSSAVRKVLGLDCAEDDLLEAKSWYEDQEAGCGQRVVDEVESVAQTLARGRAEYAIRFDDVRRVNLTIFPYALYYFLEKGDIMIIGILHI